MLEMKYAIVFLLPLITINSCRQESNLLNSWNNLGNQFLYRVQVLEDFASHIAKTNPDDTISVDSLKNIGLRLKRKLSQTETFDSLYISEVKVLNKKVIGLLPRIESITTEEFINLQASLENVENRISLAKKQYNELCYKMNRKDLVY